VSFVRNSSLTKTATGPIHFRQGTGNTKKAEHRMITLKIGNDVREIRRKTDVDESWINRQINARRADGLSVCVQVTIHDADCDVILSTPGCGGGMGGSRQPNPSERAIIDLWAKRGLNNPNFTGGNLIAFLHQLLKR